MRFLRRGVAEIRRRLGITRAEVTLQVSVWLIEPYVKEFVNTRTQSWFMNDFMNETRRVYIGKEHVNIDAQHSATGDSIGFWDDDKLVVWTNWVNPADYFRAMPQSTRARRNLAGGGRPEWIASTRHAGDVLRLHRLGDTSVRGVHARCAARARSGRCPNPELGVRFQQ
jgi:hypothetical protein